jgi:hypothetical protein
VLAFQKYKQGHIERANVTPLPRPSSHYSRYPPDSGRISTSLLTQSQAYSTSLAVLTVEVYSLPSVFVAFSYRCNERKEEKIYYIESPTETDDNKMIH